MSSPSEEVRVLFVGWPGGGSATVPVEDEVGEIEHARATTPGPGRLTPKRLIDPDWEDVAREITDFDPQIVHISAHGEAHGTVHVRSRVAGAYTTLRNTDLADALRAAAPNLQLAVFNICHARQLIQHMGASVPAMGPTERVDADAARAFAGALYAQLVQEAALESAFAVAHSAAQAAAPAAPARYIRVLPAGHPTPVGGLLPVKPRAAPSRAAPPPAVAPAAGAPREVQILVVLDAFQTPFPLDELLEQVHALGHNPRRKLTLHLSKQRVRYAPVPFPAGPAPLDWPKLSEAVRRLAERIRAKVPPGGRKADIIVSGYAPLPLMAQLGYALGSWFTGLILFNRRPGPPVVWDRLDLDALPPGSGAPFFDEYSVEPTPPELKPLNRVAVLVDNLLRPGPFKREELAKVRAFAGGQEHRGHVILRQTRSVPLTEANAADAIPQLFAAMSEVNRAFPGAEGVDLFVAGSAPLALLAGRAINPNKLPSVRIPQHTGTAYVPAVELPWPPA